MQRAKKGGTRAVTRLSKEDWAAAELHAKNQTEAIADNTRRILTLEPRVKRVAILAAVLTGSNIGLWLTVIL